MKIADPQTRRWSKEEFYRMAELGWFQDQRAELIEGEIAVQSPQSPRHFKAADRVSEVLRGVFSSNAWVRMQGPLDLGDVCEPEPDVSVVPGRRDDYRGHPDRALLLVEVSDTSLEYDRGPKAGLYARAGIADYWIINLTENRLEVYRRPTEHAHEPSGRGYSERFVLAAGEHVAPLALPQERIAIGSLLGG